MFKVLIPAVAALGLVAFTAQSGTRTASETSGATAPAMGWSVHHEGALAKLAYGVPNSDQLTLMVSCMPGDRHAVVYSHVQLQGAQPVKLAGRAVIDPLSGGDAEETRLGFNDPALRTLARQGRMDVRGEAGLFRIPASAQERRLVQDFLAYCAPARV